MKAIAQTCGCRSHNGLLTAAGLRAAEVAAVRGLTQGEMFDRLDEHVSVSAYEPRRGNLEYDELTESELSEVLDGS